MGPLLSLVNGCLMEGVFPNCLKIAKTVPIFKKDNPTDVGIFRPISTIVPVLGKIIETSMLRKLTERKLVDLVMCDLTKAFDCVSHNILLNKLHRYGIGDSAWSMVADYLSDRRQVVSVMGTTFEERRITHGVPPCVWSAWAAVISHTHQRSPSTEF
ncbi:uncharacterized protein LOC120349609 [Nilaparvata lugens]|uniref:uncharacterized protein LOC120349609 n=1 Tax=Nilaparvata lugens TaxID=108931 RepID=UPI00193E8E66|nr:uncharacterized protein LOC120349609 [Nilaparvata lugens]